MIKFKHCLNNVLYWEFVCFFNYLLNHLILSSTLQSPQARSFFYTHFQCWAVTHYLLMCNYYNALADVITVLKNKEFGGLQFGIQ